jgi:hypothetical protein
VLRVLAKRLHFQHNSFTCYFEYFVAAGTDEVVENSLDDLCELARYKIVRKQGLERLQLHGKIFDMVKADIAVHALGGGMDHNPPQRITHHVYPQLRFRVANGVASRRADASGNGFSDSLRVVGFADNLNPERWVALGEEVRDSKRKQKRYQKNSH